MALNSSRLFLAGQRMLAERIHYDAAGAGVSLADCTTQAETDGHADMALLLLLLYMR